jgi:Protein of unknown function (DUF3011)
MSPAYIAAGSIRGGNVSEYFRRVGSTLVSFVIGGWLLVAAAPAESAAQDTRVISCGSPSAFQSKCNTGGYATSVRLVRDQSGGRCKQNSTWGFTSSFVWTQEKCLGDFEITYRSTTETKTGTRKITCGTTSGDRVECSTNGYATQVRLRKDLNGNRCRQNSTWGYTDSFIWANRGCRAEFEVTYGSGTPSKPALTSGARVITCGNKGGDNTSCNAFGKIADVELLREHSNGRCRQNSTWGYSSSDIWVKNGCWADFTVTYVAVPQRR